MPRKKPPAKRLKRAEGVELLTGFVPLGSLIAYYREGWYHGYLEEVKGSTVRVRPMAPKDGAQPRSVTVGIEDLRGE